MDAETKAFFNGLINSDPTNKVCIDCDAPHPQWASVSYGTYFCLNCSGVHRSLGVHLSFVRSVSMDTWSEKHQKIMQLGGNGAFKKFAIEQGIDKFSIQEKYNTVAAEYYRNKIKAAYDNATPPVLPAAGTGKNMTNGMQAKKSLGGQSMGSVGNSNFSKNGPTSFGNPAFNNQGPSGDYGLSYQQSKSNQPYGGDLFSDIQSNATGLMEQMRQSASQFADYAGQQAQQAKQRASEDGWFDFDNITEQARGWVNGQQSYSNGDKCPPPASGWQVDPNAQRMQSPHVQHQTSNASTSSAFGSNVSNCGSGRVPTLQPATPERQTSPSPAPSTPAKPKPITFREKSPERVGKPGFGIGSTSKMPNLTKPKESAKVDVWDTNTWFDEI